MNDSKGRQVRYQSNGPLKPPRAVTYTTSPSAMPKPAQAARHLALIAVACFAIGWAITAAVLHHHK